MSGRRRCEPCAWDTSDFMGPRLCPRVGGLCHELPMRLQRSRERMRWAAIGMRHARVGAERTAGGRGAAHGAAIRKEGGSTRALLHGVFWGRGEGPHVVTSTVRSTAHNPCTVTHGPTLYSTTPLQQYSCIRPAEEAKATFGCFHCTCDVTCRGRVELGLSHECPSPCIPRVSSVQSLSALPGLKLARPARCVCMCGVCPVIVRPPRLTSPALPLPLSLGIYTVLPWYCELAESGDRIRR